jgi:hypothetical protein
MQRFRSMGLYVILIAFVLVCTIGAVAVLRAATGLP